MSFLKSLFGGGKSEKLDPAQRQLALTGVDEIRAAVVERTQKITYERSKTREPRTTPAETFAHVPVTETVEVVARRSSSTATMRTTTPTSRSSS